MLGVAGLHLPVSELHSGSQPRIGRSRSPKTVIIIGAGLAGLVSAYELTKAGHAVTLLEAQARPGGRVLTLRKPFPDGLYAEAGASFFSDSHNYTLQYVRFFQLPIQPVRLLDPPVHYHVRGKLITVAASGRADWPFALTPTEVGLGLYGMLDTYVRSKLGEVGDPTEPGWPPAALVKYDGITFEEFFRRQGASPGALTLLRPIYGLLGDGIGSVSALQVLRDAAIGFSGKQWYSVKGGNDQLADAFAAHLADKIWYKTQVVNIQHDARTVTATILQAGMTRTLTADFLICAVPHPALRQIEVVPRFSREKQTAIDDLSSTSVSRIFLQTSRKFWLDKDPRTRIYTDLPVMNVSHATVGQPGHRGILQAYLSGTQARRIAAMQESARVSYIRQHMQYVYPGISDHFEAGVSKSWDHDRWSGGAYAWFKPGQMQAFIPYLARPERRLHFAGDYTSPWPGWMQGALYSGVRVAHEIDTLA